MAVPRAPPPTKRKEKNTATVPPRESTPETRPFQKIISKHLFPNMTFPSPFPSSPESRGKRRVPRGKLTAIVHPESWSEAADDKRASGGDRAKIETDRLEFRPERMEAFTIGTQTHALVEAWIRGVRSYSGRFTDPSLIGFRAIFKKKSTAAFYLYFLKV